MPSVTAIQSKAKEDESFFPVAASFHLTFPPTMKSALINFPLGGGSSCPRRDDPRSRETRADLANNEEFPRLSGRGHQEFPPFRWDCFQDALRTVTCTTISKVIVPPSLYQGSDQRKGNCSIFRRGPYYSEEDFTVRHILFRDSSNS